MFRNKISLAPLPTINDLFNSLFSFPLNDDNLNFNWLKENEYGFWFNKSAFSLKLIVELKSLLNKNKKVNIWIPEFFCNESLEIIRSKNVSIIFYPLNNNLIPNFKWCDDYAKKISPDIFVHVHYMGDVNYNNKIKKFCSSNNAWYIEDAVHSINLESQIGIDSDFIIFSQHKHFAIPNGAFLVLRKNGVSKLGLHNNLFSVINKLITTYPKNHLKLIINDMIWIIKRCLQIIGFHRSYLKSNYWPDKKLNYSFSSYKMSIFSKRLLILQLNKIDKIIEKRKKNNIAWCNLFHRKKFNKVKIKHLKVNSVPYLSCFDLNNFMNANKFYDYCKNNYLPIMTWPDLPPEVLNNKKLNIGVKLRKTRVYFPLHQSVIKTNLIIKDFLKNVK